MDSSILSKIQRLELVKAALDKEYNTFKLQHIDLNDHIFPTRGRFQFNDFGKGDRRNFKIIDNTATLAAFVFAAGMSANATSPSRSWKRITTADPELAEFGPVKDWLYQVDTRMNTYFSRSNLYQNTPVAYGDMGVFGTGLIVHDEDDDVVSRFYSVPVGSFRLAKDFRGRVNIFCRDLVMTVRQVVEQFGQVDAKTGKAKWDNFSRNIKDLWDNSNYEKPIKVVHFVEPNAEYNPRKILDKKARKFSSYYYEVGVSNDVSSQSPFLKQSGYSYFPAYGLRYQATGNDVYGTWCPGMNSIGDIKQLQHGEKKAGKAIDKMVDPAMVATSNLRGRNASIISAEITWIDNATTDKFEPAHMVNIDLNHLNMKQEQIRRRIEEAFHKPLFMALNSLDDRTRTAYEISERKKELLLAAGPVVEQLNEDFLIPLVDNQFYLMQGQGLIPPPPEELQGQDLKLEFISPMASAQKMIALGTMDRLLEVGSAILKINPQSATKFDFDQIIDEYADGLGTPPRIVRSDEKVQQIRQQMAQAQAKQQQAEQIGQMAQAAKNLSGADLEGDNALSRLTDQQTGNP